MLMMLKLPETLGSIEKTVDYDTDKSIKRTTTRFIADKNCYKLSITWWIWTVSDGG